MVSVIVAPFDYEHEHRRCATEHEHELFQWQNVRKHRAGGDNFPLETDPAAGSGGCDGYLAFLG